MKHIFILALSVIIANSTLGQTACHGTQVFLDQDGQCDNDPYVLVFEDDFDGNSLDFTKWQIQYQGVQSDFNFNQEKEWYVNTGNTPSIDIGHNIEVSNGTLKLITVKETTPIQGTYVTDFSTTPYTYQTESFNYSSGKIVSNKQFGYGKYEIRCKIPKGKGFFPAFWTYGNANNSGDEIDVFEFWNENNDLSNLDPSDLLNLGDYDPNLLSRVVNMTVHHNGELCHSNYEGPDFSQDFHVFTIIYDAYKIDWYVDGTLQRESSHYYDILGQPVGCSDIKEADNPYIQDIVYPVNMMNIIANLAISDGNGAGSPDDNTTFPSTLEIDYIRYYQQKQDNCFNTLGTMNVGVTGYASQSTPFGIYGLENVSSLIFQIFDVTGQTLMRQESYTCLNGINQPIYWDGKIGGNNEAPSGTYIYDITATNDDGSQTFSGTLLKLDNGPTNPPPAFIPCCNDVKVPIPCCEYDYNIDDVNITCSQLQTIKVQNDLIIGANGPVTITGNVTLEGANSVQLLPGTTLKPSPGNVIHVGISPCPPQRLAAPPDNNNSASSETKKDSIPKNETDTILNPSSFFGNLPNPFKDATTICYSIQGDGTQAVKIEVCDIYGRVIATPVNNLQHPTGSFTVPFNGSTLVSGVYYYTITAGNYKKTKKMVVMR